MKGMSLLLKFVTTKETPPTPLKVMQFCSVYDYVVGVFPEDEDITSVRETFFTRNVGNIMSLVTFILNNTSSVVFSFKEMSDTT